MLLVAENLTAADPVIAAAIAARQPDPIVAVAAAAARANATYLDVNLGPRNKQSTADLSFVLDVLSDHWPRGIWIDGVDADLMALADDLWPHEVVLNGYGADPVRAPILELAALRGLRLVVFLMGSRIPPTLDERLALAAQLVGRCAERGVPPERLLIDPVIAPMGWMDGQSLNAALLPLLRMLPSLFGPEIGSVVGLSNLVTGSTGQARIRWLEEAFLAAAAGAGLTHAMVNVRSEGIVRTARALDVFADVRAFAPSEFL